MIIPELSLRMNFVAKPSKKAIKEFLAAKVAPGMTMSVGVPLGVGVIVFTIILTWIYVRRANSEFDDTNEAIIKEAQK